MYVTQATLRRAIQQLYGTAGHLLKIWFVLKQMGFKTGGSPLQIDTANSKDSLKRLFSCGAADGRFFVPFSHTPRYLTMKHDASRSIIQTNIQRWASSGSVVTCDPTDFIDISSSPSGKLLVRPTRNYPFGLGVNESGFARGDGDRVSLPLAAFAIWYGRQALIPDGEDAADYLINHMLTELGIGEAERELIFLPTQLNVETQQDALTDDEIFEACNSFIQGDEEVVTSVVSETFDNYARKVKGMVTNINTPAWLRVSPVEETKNLIDGGAKVVLLYGPPRTGKTRFIDSIVSRNDPNRETIQIHEGWGYDNLVQGLKPSSNGDWDWQDGPLKSAIQSGKTFIVLEEINRTQFTQSLGEVFSLIEDQYRGEEYAITLRDDSKLFIPNNVVFLLTMNTVDKSTEDVDDALMGRVAAVEFPPRAEDLSSMLNENGVPDDIRQKVSQLYAEILEIYPIGHGYFAGLNHETTAASFLSYYKSRVRPVLYNFLGELKELELNKIDNLADQLFALG